MTRGRTRFPRRLLAIAAICLSLSAAGSALAAQPAAPCTSTVIAQVVALDSAIFANRMGAQLPDAMIFALAGDVQPASTEGGVNAADWTTWKAGNVELKGYKRPRPIVLRVNAGQCLQVQFRNLVSPTVVGTQPSTRATSLHVQGLNWLNGPADDGAWIGANASSLSNPGDPVRTYNLYAPEEGPFLLYSAGDVASFSGGGPATGSQGGDGGQLQQGLFGAVTVEPAASEQYRSQVNHEDLCLATVGSTWQDNACTAPAGPPTIDYQAVYPAGHPRAGLPVLRMTQTTPSGTFLVHSDLTAVISGPNAGPFASTTAPGLNDTPVSPDRQEPFREFTIIYHEMFRTTQAFTELYAAPQLGSLMESANDNFAINYGMGGIGSEILANRLNRGPAADCLDCKYEEFFLSSWTNGDPAMVVDVPADQGCAIQDADQGYPSFACPPATAATKAYYPDDPSNVYHSYLWDHTRFRILHGGSDLHHVHHLHAHQWLHSPNTSSGHYLDSQAIGPGAAFTLEMVYNGSGNKNLTVGDSIFHCHFYPHFAAGMWSLWRVHDVFEAGTQLDGYPGGRPAQNARALPDGEIVTGTPIPALVPISTNALAPAPAPVRLTENGTVAEVCTDSSLSTCVSALSTQGNPEDFENPGYPFFIPGMAGSRSPHPPMDFALACSNSGAACGTAGESCGAGGTCQAIDGGLPRHIVLAEAQVNKFASPAPANPNVATPALNPLDFTKEVLLANGVGLPEQGTVVEQVAMQYHARRTHASQTPGGQAAEFITNGRPPRQGAPYADPCIDIEGAVPAALRNLDYWGVDFQTDAVFNKEGWHFPQQRMISLWGDLFDFLGLDGGQKKAPEPFFIRANSNDCVHYRLANLIPKTFELDDFQVRTPTDILGQHIHLVKFDVTSSDGGANGFNYEDGTLAPDEVVERINAFNNGSWKASVDAQPSTEPLTPAFIKFFGADPSCAQNPDSPACQCQVVEYQENGHTKQGVKGGHWCGAQATVQTWYVDPTLNNAGQDLTLRTVFTHDHFGPSTHQQAGVYAALVSEPRGSTWHDNETGDTLGGRTATQNGVSLQDGGPTSWQAVIRTTSQPDSFREFLFALQDSTLMYRPFPAAVKAPACPAGTATCGFCSTEPSKACSLDPTSAIYWETVCTKVVSLPNPKNLRNSTQGLFAPTSLQPSCNFVPGIPSRNSLFFQTASGPNPSSNNPGNIWGGVNADLTALGWDTLPIMPSPKGVFAGGQANPAQPEVITLDGATQNFSVNYRNEPIYPRLYSNGATTPQDLATVYQSLPRTLPGAVAPSYAPLTAGVGADDPFTPLLRANAGDNVQVRLVVGAHQNPHNFMLHGNKWLFEPSNVNSGWRASQTMGISEHFEFLFRVPGPWTPPTGQQALASTDYLYRPTAAKQGQMSGSWGILRAYNAPAENLFPVPGAQAPPPVPVCPAALMSAQCGANDGQGHILRCYDVVAARVEDAFRTTGKPLTLNTELGWTAPNSILYFLAADFTKLQAGQAVPGIDPATGLAEPLVLRAAAGDCIKVNLTNNIPPGTQLGQGFSSSQMPVDGLAGQPAANRGLFVPSNTSASVGLHPQLVAYDAARGDGMNVGNNPTQTAAPGESVTYWWYAGAVDGDNYIPVELGAANLLPADPVNHHPYNLFAALVIEPEGATWTTDPNSRASATVKAGGLTFREQVLVMQDDGVIFTSSGVRQVGGGAGAFNLRTEPLAGQQPFRQCTNTTDQSCVFSNQAVCNGGACGNPQTPVFCAQAGQEARIRLLHPGGAVTNNIFEVFGHTFAEEPYTTAAADCAAPTTHTNVKASGVIQVGNQCPDGTVTIGPSLTEWKGSRNGHGPGNHFDVVIQKAGGQNARAGDYLYRSFPAPHLNSGIWGILRVTPDSPTAAACPSFTTPGTAP
jgi:hypothetical protein